MSTAPRWRNIVNILNAVGCFIFVLGYLLLSAIPKYNSPVWESSIDISSGMPFPATAMIMIEGANAFAPARFSEVDVNGDPIDLPAFVFLSNTTAKMDNYTTS